MMTSKTAVWFSIPGNPYNTFVELAREIAQRSEGIIKAETVQCFLSRAFRGTLPRRSSRKLVYECLLAKTEGNETLALRLYSGLINESVGISGGKDLATCLITLSSNPLLLSLLVVVGTMGNCTEEEIRKLMTIAVATTSPLKASTLFVILDDLREKRSEKGV